jgi:hypothetical protein
MLLGWWRRRKQAAFQPSVERPVEQSAGKQGVIISLVDDVVNALVTGVALIARN